MSPFAQVSRPFRAVFPRSWVLTFALLACLACGGGGGGTTTTPPPPPPPPAPDLYGVASGGGLWVSVGASGTIQTSPMPFHAWTPRVSGSTANLRKVAYGNGAWVAVGDGGTVLTSPDAVTWTAGTSGTQQNLKGVVYGNGVWVTVGAAGTLLTSPDAATWTSRLTVLNQDLADVTYADNGTGGVPNPLWVAVGQQGKVVVSINADASKWGLESANTGDLYGVAYDPNFTPQGPSTVAGRFVAVGAGGVCTYSTLAVAFTWAPVSTLTTQNLNRVAATKGTRVQVVAVGDGGTVYVNQTVMGMNSLNGVSTLGTAAFADIANGNGVWMAVGAGGATYISDTAVGFSSWTKVK